MVSATSHDDADIQLTAQFDPDIISVEEVRVPDDSRGVYFTRILRNVLTVAECEMLIAATESHGYEPAKVNIGGGMEKLISDYRKSDRCIIDSDGFAATLWGRIQHTVPLARRGQVAVGLNERLRFLRYDPGDFFCSHRDGTYVRRMERGADREGERSRITVQLYLNHVEKGGATTVYSDSESKSTRVVPEPGMVFLFDHAVLHDGELVEAGRKYAIRTEVMYKDDDSSQGAIEEPVEAW